MNAPPAALLAARFTARVEALREAEPDIVAIQPAPALAWGKSSRRANAPPLHLVSAPDRIPYALT